MAVASLAGCAATDVSLRRDLDATNAKLADAERRLAQSDKKLQDMEDRVFLLTDQIESAKVAQARTAQPRLPVVTLRPAAEPEPQQPSSVVMDDSGVEYRGEAARPSASIDLTGSHPAGFDEAPRRARAARTPSRPTPTPAALPPVSGAPGGDNLGVAPAPPIAAAGAHATAPVASAPSALSDAGDLDPIRAYRSAFDDLKAGRHDVAAQKFRVFLKKWPHHDYADNAQYWLAECFYDRRAYAEAASGFAKVVTLYPSGNKAPDAMVKMALAAIALGDARRGRELLKQVPEIYPHTDAARVAAERLAELDRGAAPERALEKKQ